MFLYVAFPCPFVQTQNLPLVGRSLKTSLTRDSKRFVFLSAAPPEGKWAKEDNKKTTRTWEEHEKPNSSQKDSPKRFSQEMPRADPKGSKGIQRTINKTSAPLVANNCTVWTLGSSELTSAAAAAETQPWQFRDIATWTKQNQRLNTSEQNQVVRQNSIHNANYAE